VTFPPEPADRRAAQPSGLPYPDTGGVLPGGYPDPPDGPDPGLGPVRASSRSRRGVRWAAMMTLLALGVCGLAAAAVGAVDQVLPRRFTAAQQQQIMTWEMTSRWRALDAGAIFPAVVPYEPGPLAYQGGPVLDATRLGIAAQASCSRAVSAAAARVLAADHCSIVLRATYLDASGSMVATIGVAVLPDRQTATAAVAALKAGHKTSLTVQALPVAGTPAAGFRDRQRQLSYALGAGPYVVMSTAGFTDERRAVPLSEDAYYNFEMQSLTQSLVEAVARTIGVQPAEPRCPGSPGC
jgi:hypothetical protein